MVSPPTLHQYYFKRFAVSNCALFVILSSGCGTLPNGHQWGEDVSIPSWKRIERATIKAAKNPNTWVPAIGAVVFSSTRLDKTVSKWAADTTPIFGSQRNASEASDKLRATLNVAAGVSFLATPGGDKPGPWLNSKFKGFLVEGAAHATTAKITGFIKSEADRFRPNGNNDHSFPSGHANAAFTSATLSSRNVEAMNISETSKDLLDITFKSLATGAAWARVEGKQHYPSDVLVSAALSHFVSAVIYDSFMGIDDDTNFSVQLSSNSSILQFGWRF